MNYRRITGVFGGAAGALTVGAELAQAQDNAGGTISIGGGALDGLGDEIFNSVTNAVYGGSSESSASGGVSVEHTEASFGEQEGVAIADASGGNNNLSFVS